MGRLPERSAVKTESHGPETHKTVMGLLPLKKFCTKKKKKSSFRASKFILIKLLIKK